MLLWMQVHVNRISTQTGSVNRKPGQDKYINPTFHFLLFFRPVAGYLNFCPRHLRGRHSFSRMVSFVLHEMIRALVGGATD